ncbi:hypothetical protein LEMLEM_LOCUS9364, partial [Lemmus lemmus]
WRIRGVQLHRPPHLKILQRHVLTRLYHKRFHELQGLRCGQASVQCSSMLSASS